MTFRRIILLLALVLLPAPAYAQVAPLTGDAIVARFQEALGGLAAFAAVTSLHSTGDLLIPAAGIGGTVEVWQARPNRSVMRVDIPGWGEVRNGYTGSAGWSLSTAEGPRLMTGAEALQAADDAHFDSLLRTRELVDSLVFVESTTLAGHSCELVRVVWRTGRVSNDCYSGDTGLLIGSTRRQLSGDVATESVILYDDYRSFGAIRIPTKITTRTSGIDQVINLLEVRLNGVPDDAFLPPAPVRALIRG